MHLYIYKFLYTRNCFIKKVNDLNYDTFRLKYTVVLTQRFDVIITRNDVIIGQIGPRLSYQNVCVKAILFKMLAKSGLIVC